MRRYVTEEDGSIFKEEITRTPIDITASLLAQLSAGTVLSLRNACVIPGFGPASISLSGKDSYWTVPMESIQLNTWFKKVGDILVPVFREDAGLPTPMTLTWRNSIATTITPMRLIFLAHVVEYPPTAKLYRINKVYFFAFSKDGNAWRLPLANLYEHCEVCNGDFSSQSGTAEETVQLALEQFTKSQWNKDLTDRTSNPGFTAKMFRFQPKGDKDFEQLPVNATDWIKVADKISNPDIVKYVVL